MGETTRAFNIRLGVSEGLAEKGGQLFGVAGGVRPVDLLGRRVSGSCEKIVAAGLSRHRGSENAGDMAG